MAKKKTLAMKKEEAAAMVAAIVIDEKPKEKKKRDLVRDHVIAKGPKGNGETPEEEAERVFGRQTLYLYENEIRIGKVVDTKDPTKNHPGTMAPMQILTNAPPRTKCTTGKCPHTPTHMSEWDCIVRIQHLMNQGHNMLRAEEILHKERYGVAVNKDALELPAFRLLSVGDTFGASWLEHHVKGIKNRNFRVERIALKTRDIVTREITDNYGPLGLADLAKRIHISTRAWASSWTLQLLFVEGVRWADYDSLLGMTTGYSRKQSKRENENVRIAELWVEGSMANMMNKFQENHPEGDEAYDGQIVIDASVLQWCINNNPDLERREQYTKQLDQWIKTGRTEHAFTSGNIRMLFDGLGKGGLGKGDYILANPKRKIHDGMDVIMHPGTAIKEEKGMGENRFFITLTPHHRHTMPRAGETLIAWTKDFLVTEDRLMETFDANLADFEDHTRRGEFPEHLLRSAKPHDEEGKFLKTTFQDTVNDSIKRWINSGEFSLLHSSYLMERAYMGFHNKVQKDIDRLSVPMPWASYMYVTTHEVLTNMAGWDLSGYGTWTLVDCGFFYLPVHSIWGKAFWHKEAGRFSYPAWMFKKIFARHGGWDLDDSIMVMLRLIKDENGPYNYSGTRFRIVAVGVRYPNGLTYFGPDEAPGEYSVFEIDLDIKVDHETMVDILQGKLRGITPEGYEKLIGFPLYNVYDSIIELFLEDAPKNTHVMTIQYTEATMPRDQDDRAVVVPADLQKKLDIMEKLRAKAKSTRFKPEQEAFDAKAEKMEKSIADTMKAAEGKPYSPEDAVRQMYLGIANPGIGQVVNALTSYVEMFGTYPDWMPAALEQLVDALEQTPDFEVFRIIEQFISYLKDEMLFSDKNIDYYIAAHRVSDSVEKFLRRKHRIRSEEDSKFARMNNHMRKELGEMKTRLIGQMGKKEKANVKGYNLEARKTIDFGEDTIVDCGFISLPVGPMMDPLGKKLAQYIFGKFGVDRWNAPKLHKFTLPGTKVVVTRQDPYIAYAARLYFIKLNDDAVNTIFNSTCDWDKTILALYQIVFKAQKDGMGQQDNVLFQTSELGTNHGMQDLLMGMLCKRGFNREDLFSRLAYEWAEREQARRRMAFFQGFCNLFTHTQRSMFTPLVANMLNK